MPPKMQLACYDVIPVAVNSIERRNRGTLDRCVFDHDYLERLTRGDLETERHFTTHFGQFLLIKLRGRLRCPQTIADARQETFLRVFAALRKKGVILHPERLGGFVNSVCENVLLEFFRSGKRAVQMPEDNPEPQDRKASTEAELITEERKQLVKATLNQLSEGDRTLLQDLFLKERDRDEMCGELNVDRDYLRVRVHRALKRFRACLEASAPARTFSAGGLS